MEGFIWRHTSRGRRWHIGAQAIAKAAEMHPDLVFIDIKLYENRSKAIYWDGRNEFGESVASGVYFYHLAAGHYSVTRRMVILK